MALVRLAMGALRTKASLPPKPLGHLEWLDTDTLPSSNFVTAAVELAMAVSALRGDREWPPELS
jgi:hypothetical protein